MKRTNSFDVKLMFDAKEKAGREQLKKELNDPVGKQSWTDTSVGEEASPMTTEG